MTRAYIEDLVKSAPLHDIVKVGVPDSILLKTGRLTPAEMKKVKKHCELDALVLEKAEQKLNFQSFLAIVIQVARYHHEMWNGKGYPYGLCGEKIPISGRIMALADNYDALRSERVYKEAFPHQKCRQIILEQRGEHFDPLLVDAFLSAEAEFERISEELSD